MNSINILRSISLLLSTTFISALSPTTPVPSSLRSPPGPTSTIHVSATDTFGYGAVMKFTVCIFSSLSLFLLIPYLSRLPIAQQLPSQSNPFPKRPSPYPSTLTPSTQAHLSATNRPASSSTHPPPTTPSTQPVPPPNAPSSTPSGPATPKM
jgi:hypothetical protein